MAKSKFKLSSGSIKDFFIQHVEKIVLGSVLVLMALFIWRGSSVETFPSSKTPATLTNAISTATNHMNLNSWPKVEATAKPPSIVDPIVLTVRPDPWALGSMDPPIKPSRSKRRDPAIYPPTKLVVDSAIAGVAILPGEEEVYELDRIMQLKAEKDAEAMAIPLFDDSTSTKKKKDDKKKKGREQEEPQYGPTGPGSPGMPRTLSETDRQQLQGYRPSGQSVPKTRNIIAVKALINVKKQMEEYIDALGGNAANFREDRDTPKYIFFYVERADVTADPNADPKTLKWVPQSTKAAMSLYAMRDAEWEALPEEVIDPANVLPGLTLPVPPVLLTDIKKLAGHPDIAFASDVNELAAAAMTKRNPDEPEEVTEGPEFPDAMTLGPGGERGGPGGIMNGPAVPIGREGGRGGSYASPGTSGSQFPTYKLFRYIDFNVERGRKYRYRVKLTLENPNHPQIAPNSTTDPSPPPQSLDKEVEAKLRELAKEEARLGRRIFYRDTDWSEPSAVISLPDPVIIAGGEVTPARSVTVPGGKIQMTEPEGKVMVVQWDEQLATQVVAQEEVQLGSVINFKKDGEALHPVKYEYVEMKDYPFESGALVVDMRGGEKRDARSAMVSPSEIAIVDSNGMLVVRSEQADEPYWQRYGTFEPKKIIDPLNPDGPPGSSSERGRNERGFDDIMAPTRPRSTRNRG